MLSNLTRDSMIWKVALWKGSLGTIRKGASYWKNNVGQINNKYCPSTFFEAIPIVTFKNKKA